MTINDPMTINDEMTLYLLRPFSYPVLLHKTALAVFLQMILNKFSNIHHQITWMAKRKYIEMIKTRMNAVLIDIGHVKAIGAHGRYNQRTFGACACIKLSR